MCPWSGPPRDPALLWAASELRFSCGKIHTTLTVPTTSKGTARRGQVHHTTVQPPTLSRTLHPPRRTLSPAHKLSSWPQRPPPASRNPSPPGTSDERNHSACPSGAAPFTQHRVLQADPRGSGVRTPVFSRLKNIPRGGWSTLLRPFLSAATLGATPSQRLWVTLPWPWESLLSAPAGVRPTVGSRRRGYLGFNFLGNLHTAPHSGRTISHPGSVEQGSSFSTSSSTPVIFWCFQK